MTSSEKKECVLMSTSQSVYNTFVYEIRVSVTMMCCYVYFFAQSCKM